MCEEFLSLMKVSNPALAGSTSITGDHAGALQTAFGDRGTPALQECYPMLISFLF